MNKKIDKPKFETDVYIGEDLIKINIRGHANIHLKSKDGKKEVQKKWKMEKKIEIGLMDEIKNDEDINELIKEIENEVEKKTDDMKKRFKEFLEKLRQKWKILKIEW